jgi:cysteine desulfurase
MLFKFKKTIYLDYASSAPLDSSIARAIKESEKLFANAHGIHDLSILTQKAVDGARERIASCLRAHADEIIFTGSGTESNALAILGAVNNYYREGGKTIPHIVTSVIEHPAVLENCRMLERDGRAEVTYVPIEASGIVSLKDIKAALKDNTILVSIMYANNEIGTIQPIEEIAKIIRHFRKNKGIYPLFHTDACQAMNYLFTENIEKLGVDMLSFNSSKIYGPKGVGVLYKKRSVELSPIYMGGGQEFGLRPGTLNTSGIIGISLSLEKAMLCKSGEVARLTIIRDYAICRLLELSEDFPYTITLNGDDKKRLPNNINISISGIESELLVIELSAKGIMVSAKSACKSEEPEESHVIAALRKAQRISPQSSPYKGEEELPLDSTAGSFRISMGREIQKSDIDTLIKALRLIFQKYTNYTKI